VRFGHYKLNLVSTYNVDYDGKNKPFLTHCDGFEWVVILWPIPNENKVVNKTFI
jgi:hypothetical protein